MSEKEAPQQTEPQTTEVPNDAPTEEVKEVETPAATTPIQTSFKYEVTAESPVTIDFSGHENQDAVVMLVELAAEKIDNKVTVTASAEVPKEGATNDETETETQKIELCSFDKDDVEEKSINYVSSLANKSVISVEGTAKVVVSGVFAEPVSGEEEEDCEDNEEKEVENLKEL